MTKTDIANSCMVKIGADPIMSFDQDVKRAKFAKNRIDSVIRVVSRMHPWNCAIKRTVTSPLADETPAYTYAYAHQLPSDCLRILEINPVGLDDYRIEGRNILTDTTTVNLKYISDMTDNVQELDELMAEAIACYLAWDLAYPIVQSRSLKESIWKDFKAILKTAKSTDAKEDPALYVEANEWVDSRFAATDPRLRSD